MATALKESTPANKAERKIPVFDPQRVEVNYHGQVFKEVVARMPKDMIADDLKEGAIWKRVQSDKDLSLRKGDRVIVYSFDESRLWQSYVADCGLDFVTLSRIEAFDLKPRMSSYFQDGTYRVEWNGADFAVVRIKDGQRMGTYANEALAIRGLQNLYPARVA